MAWNELIGWASSRRLSSVRPCVHIFKRETSRPSKVKFHLKHHLGGESATLGLGLDWIRTLVDMATDSPHRVIKRGKIVTILAPSFLIGFSLFVQAMRITIKSMGSKFCKIRRMI